jgi:hypothetical protein
MVQDQQSSMVVQSQHGSMIVQGQSGSNFNIFVFRIRNLEDSWPILSDKTIYQVNIDQASYFSHMKYINFSIIYNKYFQMFPIIFNNCWNN